MINIALDGPSGAGKSTIAKEMAKTFNLTYIDTGALYRAIGLYLLRNDIDPRSAEDVCKILPNISVEFRHINSIQRVFLNGEDVSDEIRVHNVSKAASDCSAIPAVRAFLLELQRGIAKTNNVIMDGRDIGTVILPDANIKIFLTATAEDRAERRYEELKLRGETVDFERLLSDVKERDYNDANRAVAPLKQAEDAILVDTTGNTLSQSIEIIKKIIEERL